MKFNIKFLMISLILVAMSSSFAQTTTPTGSGSADPKVSEPLERIMLEDFEEAEDWRAKSTTPLGITKAKKMIQRGLVKDVFDEDSAPDQRNEKGEFTPATKDQAEKIGKNHVLGVKTYFANKGFDRVEIFPPNEYIIKGKARQVSVWVLGRNYRHTLFAKFRDYKGNLHNIRLGKLDFFGWRKLTATIPGYIPQSTRFSLLDKNIHFVSLYVTSDVHDVAGDFYFYVDNIEVRADQSEMRYPGSEIKDNW